MRYDAGVPEFCRFSSCCLSGVQGRRFIDMDEEREAIVVTERLRMEYPSEGRDDEALELYNDEETMLPYLPFLCPMTPRNMKKRRDFHRREADEGKSLFLDLVMRDTGAFVGTSGFRTIDYKSGEAEWGAVVKKEYQRRGLCREAFEACLRYLERELKGIVKLTASTVPINPMVNFLVAQGLTKRGSHTFKGIEWDDFVLHIADQRSGEAKQDSRLEREGLGPVC